MKIRLLGDHSRYHCGSKAVWEVFGCSKATGRGRKVG